MQKIAVNKNSLLIKDRISIIGNAQVMHMDLKASFMPQGGGG